MLDYSNLEIYLNSIEPQPTSVRVCEEDSRQTYKRMIDGELYIFYDNKVVNILGVELKNNH